jgi:hypothetical protein
MRLERKTGLRIAAALVCFAVLAMPLLYFFAPPGTSPSQDEFGSLYRSMVVLLGESQARVVFCALWFALDAAVIWRLFLSKSRHDVDVSPIDGLGD